MLDNTAAIERANGVVTGDQPDVSGPFFFRLIAGPTGVDELSFQRNGHRIFATMLSACEYINSTFDLPFPTTGEFIQALKESAELKEPGGLDLGDESQPDRKNLIVHYPKVKITFDRSSREVYIQAGGASFTTVVPEHLVERLSHGEWALEAVGLILLLPLTEKVGYDFRELIDRRAAAGLARLSLDRLDFEESHKGMIRAAVDELIDVHRNMAYRQIDSLAANGCSLADGLPLIEAKADLVQALEKFKIGMDSELRIIEEKIAKFESSCADARQRGPQSNLFS